MAAHNLNYKAWRIFHDGTRLRVGEADLEPRIRENAVSKGAFSGLSLSEIDEPMKKYDSSTDLAERKRLLESVQNYILDQYVFVPVCRSVFVTGFGPRLAGKPEDISGAIPQYIFIGPWEDLQVKDA